jgi:oligogalacturonide lyase
MHAVSSTGDYAYTAVRERVHSTDRRLVYNKSPHYLEKFQDHPRSDIIRIDLANGSTEVVYSEDHFIEHVNINPTDPGILSFCHEGPWVKTEQRIWGLDLRTGGTWKIRPQQGGSAIGHEFFINSDWIGYHGRRLPDEKMHFFGATKIDNSEYFEYDFPYHCTHFVSCGFDWFLGDGTPVNVQPWFPSQQRPFLMLFRRNGNDFEGPRVLANHRSTFAEQVQHPHARFSPDGSGVLYASDIGGYTNIYYIQLPEFESLPLVEDVKLGW